MGVESVETEMYAQTLFSEDGFRSLEKRLALLLLLL